MAIMFINPKATSEADGVSRRKSATVQLIGPPSPDCYARQLSPARQGW
jgi:hypothetical protein